MTLEEQQAFADVFRELEATDEVINYMTLSLILQKKARTLLAERGISQTRNCAAYMRVALLLAEDAYGTLDKVSSMVLRATMLDVIQKIRKALKDLED